MIKDSGLDPSKGESARRRHRPRSPAGRDRRGAHRDHRARPAPSPAEVRHGDDVHRHRHGRGGDLPRRFDSRAAAGTKTGPMAPFFVPRWTIQFSTTPISFKAFCINARAASLSNSPKRIAHGGFDQAEVGTAVEAGAVEAERVDLLNGSSWAMASVAGSRRHCPARSSRSSEDARTEHVAPDHRGLLSASLELRLLDDLRDAARLPIKPSVATIPSALGLFALASCTAMALPPVRSAWSAICFSAPSPRLQIRSSGNNTANGWFPDHGLRAQAWHAQGPAPRPGDEHRARARRAAARCVDQFQLFGLAGLLQLLFQFVGLVEVGRPPRACSGW